MPLSRLLDRLLGPRDWCVTTVDGEAHMAARRSQVLPWEETVRTGLRRGPAQRLARRLRQIDEDTPRRVL